MRRRRVDLFGFFTFGERVPSAVGFILALMLVASVSGWLDPELKGLAVLSPVLLARGELWRLVSWPFFQNDPFTLLFGGLMVYWLGRELSFVWTERRFLLRFFGYAAFASFATTALAFAWPPASMPHLGVWPVANALIVSWAMLYPDRQVNIWGILPITGRTGALLVVGGTLLYGLSAGGIAGVGAFSAHLFAILAAWLLSRRAMRSPLRDARRWLSDLEQKRRAKHLKVVRKNGSDDRPRWMN